METTAELVVGDVSPAVLFAHVEALERYPSWMRLVHRVDPVDGADPGRPEWDVELRGRIGPFARSKRLRMARTIHEPVHRVKFERVVLDGRDQAMWELSATVWPHGAGARLVMELAYGGDMWGSAALRRVLDDEIRRGRDALRELVTNGG
jgi:Polyketide cyclase / dehydrase and lipid transport